MNDTTRMHIEAIARLNSAEQLIQRARMCGSFDRETHAELFKMTDRLRMIVAELEDVISSYDK